MPTRPYDFAPLSDRARAWLRSKPQVISRLSGVTSSAIYAWARGASQPLYQHVAAMLSNCTSEGLSLEDFGYTELPTGQVARLLAPGHAPAPLLVYRASGDAYCETCERPYSRHPQDPKRRSVDLVLNILCDGRRVKL